MPAERPPPGTGVEHLFHPKGVAVVGASRTPGKVGYTILYNLKLSYRGPVYPVNPRAREILGLPAYPSILEVPDPVDLAAIAVPAPVVPRVLEEAGRRGVKAAIVYSGGFKEVGEEGARLERQLVEIARRYGMRILGPNCVGIYSPVSGLNATFLDPSRQGFPEAGHIALVSQSGALGIALLDWMESRGLGVSRFVSVGNKADIDEADLLAFLSKDRHTYVVAMYVEGVDDGPRFRRALEETTTVKPVAVLKAGKTSEGARAAASHTGSLAGSYEVYRAVFRQTGVVEAESSDDLFDLVLALAYQPPMRGDRVAVVTVGGGSGVMATDYLLQLGLKVPELSAETQRRLRQVLLSIASPRNPVDVTGSGNEQHLAESMRIVAESGEVDAILLIPYFTVPSISAKAPEVLAQAIHEVQVEHGLPVVVSLTGGTRAWLMARRLFDLVKTPIYLSEARAARALWALKVYGEWLRRQGVLEERLEEHRRRMVALWGAVRRM
ncbi:MAG: CoA-binding protein [Thermoproteota archaeon]